MANNTKGKHKVKGKTVGLQAFLADGQEVPSGYAIVPSRRLDWAATMDNEDIDDRYTLDYKREEKVALPTAPKAARGPDVDLTKIPSTGPFTVYLGNLPYDTTEDDIIRFFRNIEVRNIRLPRNSIENNKIKGYGYVDFLNKQDLIQALSFNNEPMCNRPIKVGLSGDNDGERGDRRDGGIDRTSGDWRSDKRDQFSRDDRSDGYQSRTGYGEPFRAKSNYERPFDRNDRYDRNDRFERNGDRNGYGNRNDRDFGRSDDRFERRNDRGYGFSDRGMNRGGGRSDGRRDGRDFREGYGRRDDRDSRFRDSSDRDGPPRDSYERSSERSSQESGGQVKERRKLQLAPPREREIEERLAKEKEIIPKDRDVDARVRKFSSGSGISNRSRRSSDSGPPSSLRDDEDSVPPYKPPLPKQPERERDQPYNTLPRTRPRCGSGSSTTSERENAAPKTNPPSNNRKVLYCIAVVFLENMKNYNSNYSARNDKIDDARSDKSQRSNSDNSFSEPVKSGFKNVRHNHSHRDNSRDRASHGATYEEPKPPVYTSANKFSHLMNDADDLDRGSNSE
ncbi:eukaryotic translation initiation factor 4B [Caerostris extrusa]|uniref:Eukaryotic translation initiation factor 4B n=1 Tax=Caerostris extrusa TaxID=172846 RepID=A0AAV4NZH0_CAEEX|nr:eukaryotic translation initiation factor 4B [Caerostris extrusa]